MSPPLTNWAGNVTFHARDVRAPASIDELREVVIGARTARALGTGHSFNHIADCDDVLISLARLPARVDISPDTATATVSAGLRYGEIGARLHAAGYAIGNLGSLPHIGVAGACATATHGSGGKNRGLASAVRAIDMMTADGEVVTLARDVDEDFPGAVVALGSLGIVTQLTLDVTPTFDIRQYVYENLPVEKVLAHFDEIAGSAYSVSLFTDWRGLAINQVWRKHRVDDGVNSTPEWMGGTLATADRHPVPGMSAANCTPQGGLYGPWHERLPHFRLEFTPSSGEELQSEYLLDREHTLVAFEALDGMRSRIAPVLQICEIRVVAADDLWLSPMCQRDSIAFHFTWKKDADAVLPVLREIEERLAPFDARPHWGKLFTISPDTLRRSYEHYADFENLMRRYDPAGKFRNHFIDGLFPRG